MINRFFQLQKKLNRLNLKRRVQSSKKTRFFQEQVLFLSLSLFSKLALGSGSVDDFSKPFIFKKHFVFNVNLCGDAHKRFTEETPKMKALSNKMRILGAKLKHEEIGSKEFFALQKKQISLIVEWSNARVASLRQMLDLPIRQAGFSSYPQPVKKSGYYGVVPDLRPYYRGKSLYYQCFDWHIDLEVSPLTEEKRHELYEKFKESDLSHIPSFFKAYIKAVKMSEKTLNELRKKYSDLIWLSLSEDSDRVLNDPEFFNFLEGANTALLNLGHDSLDRIAAECEKIVEPELKKKMLEFLSAEVTLNHFNVNHHRDRRCID